jgi:hypothetical protein
LPKFAARAVHVALFHACTNPSISLHTKTRSSYLQQNAAEFLFLCKKMIRI